MFSQEVHEKYWRFSEMPVKRVAVFIEIFTEHKKFATRVEFFVKIM